jgi:hypothetical protein
MWDSRLIANIYAFTACYRDTGTKEIPLIKLHAIKATNTNGSKGIALCIINVTTKYIVF